MPKLWFFVPVTSTITGDEQLAPYSKAEAPNTAAMQCGAQPLIFGVQLWMLTYSRGVGVSQGLPPGDGAQHLRKSSWAPRPQEVEDEVGELELEFISRDLKLLGRT